MATNLKHKTGARGEAAHRPHTDREYVYHFKMFFYSILIQSNIIHVTINMNMLSLIDVRCGATEPEPHMEMSVPLSDVHQDMFELLTFAGERGGARADRPKLETYVFYLFRLF